MNPQLLLLSLVKNSQMVIYDHRICLRIKILVSFPYEPTLVMGLYKQNLNVIILKQA